MSSRTIRASAKFLQRLHLYLLDILVADKNETTFPDLEAKIAAAKAFVHESHLTFFARVPTSSTRGGR